MEKFDMAIVAGIAFVLFIQTAIVNWIVKKIRKTDSKPQRIIILTIITLIVGFLRVSQYKNSLFYTEGGLTNLIMSVVFAWILCLIVFSSFFGRKKETMKESGNKSSESKTIVDKNNQEKRGEHNTV